jgi:hypothetical protein
LEFDAQQRGFAHDPVGQAVDVAVGSFFGGGYDPGPDLPPPPAPVQTYDDVPVSVGLSRCTYQPFLVNQVVDAEKIPNMVRTRCCSTVSHWWGHWTQTPDGQRRFEFHKTHQFPSLDALAPAPTAG